MKEHFERNKIEFKGRRLNPEKTLFYKRIGDHLKLDSIQIDQQIHEIEE